MNESMNHLSKLRYPLLLGLLVVGSWGFYNFKNPQSNLTEDPSVAIALATPKTVTALGSLKPQGEIVALAAPAGASGSRVEKLLVKEGDNLKKGQIIAIMDNHDRLQAALATAAAEVEFAKAKLQQVKAGAKQGEIKAQLAEISRLKADQQARIMAQESTVGKLKAEQKNAATEYQRYEYLYQEGAISASIRDTKKLIVDTSESNVQQAEAELNRLKNTQSPQLNGAQATLEKIEEVRPVDIEVAEQEVTRAIANLNKASADLAQTQVIATQGGTVLEILTREGETVTNQGIVEVGQIDWMYATAEVYESDIKRVKVGEKTIVTSDALPESLEGVVERIGSKVQQQEIIGTDPSSSIDSRVMEVQIRLDQASSQIARNFTNLQVTVEIQP